MPGDCLLSAAFITYAGYFDQAMRRNLFFAWTTHLQQAGVEFRSDLARVEYLSSVDERLQWQRNSLPVDDLCTENAIMLKVKIASGILLQGILQIKKNYQSGIEKPCQITNLKRFRCFFV